MKTHVQCKDTRYSHKTGVWQKSSFLVLAAIVSIASYLPAQQVSKVSPAGTKYLVYTPPSYSTGTATHPILLFLHGGGEIGDDITKLTTGTSQHYPPKLISMNQWPSSRPFIVVSPLLKRDPSIPNFQHQEWPPNYVDEVIEHVRKTYRVDATRIYVTGISIGGKGVWTYAAAYPSKVAAIVPISGKSDLTKACALKNIPVWAIHGENDGLYKPNYTIDMVNAINKCQPAGIFKPRLHLLYSRIHEGWNEIYNGTNGSDIYNWFLKFKKNNTANKTPYVNAGIDRKIVVRSQPLTLFGDYFDSDGTISSVAWTQTSGAALTLANKNTPYLRISGLKIGVYEFQLTVTDNLGGKSSDKVVVEIVSSAVAPAVTGLVLMNGKTDKDVRTLSEGVVIDKTALGLTEVNVRAVATSGTGSVRFRINGDENTRTVNAPGPYLVRKQISGPEWVIKKGEYVICATPYPQGGGKGTPGISQCYRVVVTEGTVTASRVAEEQPIITEEGEYLTADREEGNQWLLNGVEISGATERRFKPLESGVYQVRRTDADFTSRLSNILLVEKETAVVQVYPNPVTDELRVAWPDGVFTTEPLDYRIIDPTGAEVQSGNVTGEDVRIPLSQRLIPGGYVLILQQGKKQKHSRFVKQ